MSDLERKLQELPDVLGDVGPDGHQDFMVFKSEVLRIVREHFAATARPQGYEYTLGANPEARLNAPPPEKPANLWAWLSPEEQERMVERAQDSYEHAMRMQRESGLGTPERPMDRTLLIRAALEAALSEDAT